MWTVLFLAAMAASPAPPASPQSATPPAAASVKPTKAAVGPDTVVCKSVIATGTHFTTRDCRTKGEWDDMAAQSHQLVSTSQGLGQPH